MREIKFRAWDRQELKLVNAVLIDTDGTLYESWRDLEDGTVLHGVLMQYTGLEDMNGVEIYEGDLLRWRYWLEELTEDADVYKVEWLDGEARFALNCYRSGRQIDPRNDLMKLGDEFAVIGNIYENPELLDARP